MTVKAALAPMLFATVSLATAFCQTPYTAPAPPSVLRDNTNATAETKPLPDSTHVIIIKRFPVIYSDSAEEGKLHGTVVLSVLFDDSGKEESVDVVSGEPALAACATSSIGKWEIQPYIRYGKPVKVKVPLSFEFIYEQPALNTGNASPQEAGPAANYVILSKELAQKGNQKSKKFLPVYPDLARLARIQGTVIFAATVGKDGAIRELKPMHGHPMLIPAASDAVRRWHYAPYIYHGKPVPFDVRIETSFVLTGN